MPPTDAKGKEYTVEDLVAGSQKTFGQNPLQGRGVWKMRITS